MAWKFYIYDFGGHKMGFVSCPQIMDAQSIERVLKKNGYKTGNMFSGMR